MARRPPEVMKQQTAESPPTDSQPAGHLPEDLERLRWEHAQLQTQLSIINSVQRGLASRLEFQAIIDLVAEQVQAVTHAKSVSIALYDRAAEVLSWPYWVTLGQRLRFPDGPLKNTITRHVLFANAPLILGTEAEILAKDAEPPQAGWTVGKSFLGVPFTVGEGVLGALSLHDFENEQAFHPSDAQLLQTLAHSLSVALENARLFEEAEQRNAELALVNRVQAGLASKLNIQAIYDLVGDIIREIFHNIDAEIRVHDPQTNLIHFPYFTDNGIRYPVEPIPLAVTGLSAHVLRTGQTLVINENFIQEAEKYGTQKFSLPGNHPARSAIFVPLILAQQTRGLIISPT